MHTKQKKFSLIPYLLPRLQDVLFFSIFVAVIGLGPRIFNVDGDLGRHITIGNYILDTGDIPTKDLFSHTMQGEPLTPHEWASQLVFGLMDRAAELNGVVWFCALLIAVTFTLVYKQCIDRSGFILLSVGVTILAAASSSLHWLARPHLFTIFFVVIWVFGLERVRWGNPVGWWYFPVVMLFWVNFHGAYIAGFVIWGIYLVGYIVDEVIDKDLSIKHLLSGKFGINAQVKKYILVGGLSLLVTLLNPSGWHIWETSVGYLGNRYLVSHTAEYLPPNFHDPSTWPFLLMISFSLVILGLNRHRISFIHILIITAWTAMSLYSVRNAPLYSVLVAPILSEIMAKEIISAQIFVGFSALQMRLLKIETSIRGFLWPLISVTFLGFALYKGIVVDFDLQGNHFYEEAFPVDAVDWLRENPPTGQVFNYFPWGGYLLYRLWPSELVFIDGQTDFYGEALTREYEKVITLTEDWEAILNKYQITWILMPEDSMLVKELKHNSSWQLIYEDDTSGILIRSP